MTESESVALPLGDTPTRVVSGRGSRIRTCECESQSLVPYRLAIPLHVTARGGYVNGVGKGGRTLDL